MEVDLFVSTSFQVVIEGVRGSNYYSDLSIDDVAFSAGCKKSRSGLVTVTRPVTTPSTTVLPCGPGRFQWVPLIVKVDKTAQWLSCSNVVLPLQRLQPLKHCSSYYNMNFFVRLLVSLLLHSPSSEVRMRMHVCLLVCLYISYCYSSSHSYTLYMYMLCWSSNACLWCTMWYCTAPLP